ncbi:membrane protein insertase YidC [Aerococcaceae bacterium DSM 111176]|nr:membrane protein insertase YidC [Aerococcaceae bacterium DSM 111176]
MKISRKWLKLALLAGVVLFLAACSSGDVSANSTNFWDRYVLYYMGQFIIWVSNIFGGNYAFGIAIFTIIVRIILLPLNKKQMQSQREMQELQPEIDAIRAKYPNKDRESQLKMQEEQSALLEANDVNQFAGLLPMLVQLPLMMALYQAILYTPQLREGNFLWMNLGEPDPYFILPTIAALLTFYSTYLNMKSNPAQNATTKSMMFIMPAMIFFIGIGLPSAIAIYWVVTNAFTVGQTLIFNNPYKIIAEREEKRQAEKDRERALRRELRQKTGRKKKR